MSDTRSRFVTRLLAPSFSSLFQLLTAATCALSLGACAPEDPGFAEPDTEEASDDISNAKEVSGAWQVVMLGWNNRLCTGSVLSQRWILTAAHCVIGVEKEKTFDIVWNDPDTNQRVRVYNDRPLQTFHHPFATGHVGGDDIALILLDEAGLDTTWQMRIYTDPREPWQMGSDEPRGFTDVGWGQGSPDGSPDTCLPGTTGKKRMTEGWSVSRTILPWPKMVRASHPTQKICPGDSGSPWFFTRGSRFLQFAVHSGGENTEQGVLLAQKVPWIERTTEEAGAPLVCNTFKTTDGYLYKRCDDE
jgi:hypothetical protein